MTDQRQDEMGGQQEREYEPHDQETAIHAHYAAPFAGSSPCGRNTRMTAIRM